MNYIDKEYSFYSHYEGESMGRIMHYVNVICGLRYAEKIKFHGDGVLKYYGNLFATYEYEEDGTPTFKFVNDIFNKRQKQLLTKEIV